MKTRTAQLGEVCEVLMGQSPPSSAYNSDGVGLPFFQGKADFGDLHPTVRMFCNKPTRVAESGDVLMSVRAPVGPTNMARERCCIGRGLAALRAGDQMDRAFLLYFLRHAEPQIAALGTGSTFEAINRDDLEETELPLPSLPEQRRIAGMLEQADRLRRTRRYALELSDTFLPAAFLEMFGDPAKNQKGWEKSELGDLIDFLTSGSRGWAEYYSKNGDLFIRIQNVGHGELILDDLTRVHAPDNPEAKRTQVRPGDVLLSITADLGRSAWIPDGFPTAYINQHLAMLRQTRMNPVFLAAQLGSHHAKRAWDMIDRAAVKSGLNFDDVRGFTIIVPPLPLQQRFADLVREHERLRAAQRESLRQAEHLFQSLLRRAFERDCGQEQDKAGRKPAVAF